MDGQGEAMTHQTRLMVLVVCGLVAMVAWTLARWGSLGVGDTLVLPSEPCQRIPQFTLGYKRETNGIEPFSNGGWSFQGQSYMKTDVCSPGILKITADGEPALGIFPQLQVSLNSVPLKTVSVGKTQEFSIIIPQAGHVTVGYFNDYYRADVRIAFMRRISVSGCPTTPRVTLRGTSGGTVDSALGAATLYSTNIIHIEPCSTGTIALRLSGRAGGGVFPLVRLMQAGKEVARVHTGADEQKVVAPNSGPLDVELLNPYATAVDDRNVNVQMITFLPR